MNETAEGDADLGTGTGVAGVGTVVAAVTMAAVATPLQWGVDDPAIWGAAAFAIVAIGAFLAGRYALLERRLAGATAALSSVGVVLLTAYALNQGVTASLALPAVTWSVSPVFGAFFTAGLAAGIGVAQYYGIDSGGLAERGLWMGSLASLGVVGLFTPQIATTLIALPAFALFAPLSQPQLIALSQVGTAVGTAAIVVGYVVWRDVGLAYLDVRLPSIRDVAWIVAGLIVIFGALVAITMVFVSTGVESAEHGTTQQAQENPEILLVLIPASILVIGPFEELLYRNVVQKSLYETFSRYGAVVAGSVIFALVHVLAYGTAGPGEVIASLGVVFGLSLVLGTIYERTENLLVPALVHGLYNAILFTNIYVGAA